MLISATKGAAVVEVHIGRGDSSQTQHNMVLYTDIIYTVILDKHQTLVQINILNLNVDKLKFI